MQWSRGAPLRPFLEALEDEEEKLRFTKDCVQVWRKHILFLFPRLFIVAYR
ncbi:MAG: hypothetical protein KME57_11055 [Scytonema hyalinum WJT4-NPBG1]|jgi:trans-aconitate methyltransferase|nr:hypothetical protein [Scytonema hyalinum WJT4-NPBG1]